MSHTLLFGLGQAGRQVVAQVLRAPPAHGLLPHLKVSLADLADAGTQQRAFESLRGLGSGGLVQESVPAYSLDPKLAGEGQARNWFVGRVLAERWLAGRPQEAAHLSSVATTAQRTFSFAASGGTGSGVAPVLVDRFRDAAMQAERDDLLNLAVAILPPEREWGRVEDVNAAALLGELTDADGILLVDNGRLRDALAEDAASFGFLGSVRDPEILANRAIAGAVALLESFAREGQGGWGNADLARFLRPGRRAAFVTPAYSEVDAENLSRINSAGWILVNAASHALTACRAESARRVLTIVQFPRGHDVQESPDEVAGFLRARVFTKAESVDVRFLSEPASGGSVRIASFLADPLTPRVLDLFEILEDAAGNPALEDEVRQSLLPVTGRAAGDVVASAVDAHKDAVERLRRMIRDAWG